MRIRHSGFGIQVERTSRNLDYTCELRVEGSHFMVAVKRFRVQGPGF